MEFVYIQKYDFGFVPEKWAILGLQPNSSFFKFLINNNNGLVDLLINNKIKNVKDEAFEVYS